MTKSECRKMRIVPIAFEHSGLFRHSPFACRAVALRRGVLRRVEANENPRVERVHVLRGFLILSIRVNSWDSRAEKSSQAATIFACSSTGMPIFAQCVTFGNAGRTDASPAKDGFEHGAPGVCRQACRQCCTRRDCNVSARPGDRARRSLSSRTRARTAPARQALNRVATQ